MVKKGVESKLSLEDYLLMIQSRSYLNLTVFHLNQIISMHGYKKIHKVHKKLLSDAVNSLELINPCRSTLKEYVSPLVTTKMDDVMADLNDLGWQECCVTSIKTLSSWNNNTTTADNHNSTQSGGGAVASCNRKSEKSKHHRPPRSAVVSASEPPKWKSIRKRKRTAKMVNLVNYA